MEETGGKRGRWILGEDGKFVEGKASPELKPEHLRNLPDEWVTKDLADGDKVHELDDPLVASRIVKDLREKEAGVVHEKPKSESQQAFDKIKREDRNAVVPLNQERVDVVRMYVLRACIGTCLKMVQHKQPSNVRAIRHLWFTNDNINEYELRDGNPPPDSKRPKHLRGLSLEIDLLHWPRRMVDRLEKLGITVPDFEKALNEEEATVKNASH